MVMMPRNACIVLSLQHFEKQYCHPHHHTTEDALIKIASHHTLTIDLYIKIFSKMCMRIIEGVCTSVRI